MAKNNLIIVRAGDNSLHGQWLQLPYSERNYDVVISYFSEKAYSAFQAEQGVTAVLVKGGKWDGLFKTFQHIDIDSYERFWLPDDDIDVSAEDVLKMFKICEEESLAIAQPALSRKSYFSHFIFSACAPFKLRYTNYVEIMVPCLNRNTLKRALPYFEKTMSGFGLDYLWCRWSESGAFRAAIIDDVIVYHTRPVGKVLNAAIAAANGLTQKEEEEALKAHFHVVARCVPLAFAGVLKNGQPVSGRIAMAWHMTQYWWKDRADFRDPKEARAGIFKVLRRQLTKKLDMQTLF